MFKSKKFIALYILVACILTGFVLVKNNIIEDNRVSNKTDNKNIIPQAENSDGNIETAEGLVKMEEFLSHFSEEVQKELPYKVDLSYKSDTNKIRIFDPSFGIGFDPELYSESFKYRSEIFNLVSCEEEMIFKIESTLDDGDFIFKLYSPDGELQWEGEVKKGIEIIDKTFTKPQLGNWFFEITANDKTSGYCEISIGGK